MDHPPSKSWSIHTRPEIISKYEILERIGSGAYSDVYRARRLSDSVNVALKEVHDYQSAFREIEALQLLQISPNVVVLYEYFWQDDEDAVLVLEYLRTDLACVIREAKREGGIKAGEVKRWMVQILSGVDACHRNMIVHRDLKPGNFLVSEEGVLKIADFGQARMLLEPGFVTPHDNPQPYEQKIPDEENIHRPPEIPETINSREEGSRNQERRTMTKEEYFGLVDELKAKNSIDEIEKETSVHDGDTSCLATCTTSDIEDDPFKNTYSYEAEEEGGDVRRGSFTSCVGTRWFRAPELLYGSADYGLEIDLWSLGCIFAELLTLEPLFPGTSDIDQLSKIFNVLGNLTEEAWSDCSKLSDYKTISFSRIENPLGLETCLPNRSTDEISLVKKLVCFDPAFRATAMELLHDRYFNEEPLPVPISELRVPLTGYGQDEDSPGGWHDYSEMGTDSDFEDFGPVNLTKTSTGFSIQFP